ncbi:MAG TPA: PRC-barrel domain-containing protein [Planctomycetota bacterium]|nr:PRC-barrel domain-containing protein [Planctomycetota bacterium]
MTIKIQTLCLATIALGGFAFAFQSSKKTSRQDGAIPAVAEPEIHIYRADKLAGMEIMGGGDVPIGKLDALIVDSADGQLAYAVISEGGLLGVGGSRRLVPWIALYFTPKSKPSKKSEGECEIRTLLTSEQLGACPSFKKGVAILPAVERQAFVCAKLPADPTIGQAEPGRLVSTADIDGSKLRGKQNEELGKIEHVMIDPMEGRIAYSVVELGKLQVALPWQKTTVSLDQDQNLFVVTDVPRERIEASPPYVEKDCKKMACREWLEELALHYEVEPYWTKSVPVVAEQKR